MNAVRDRVVLHPETVAKGEKLAQDAAARKRKSRKSPEPEVRRRYTKRPKSLHKGVWNKALKLSNGNPRRIVVESDDSVLVVNHE